jgi:hypothetical protein
VSSSYVVVTKHPHPALDSAVKLLSAGLDAFVPSRFTRVPPVPVVVLVFPTHAEYAEFCGKHYSDVRPDPDTPSEKETCLSSLGIYFHPRRELVVDMARGRTTLLHELAHSLLAWDFAQAPRWFDECIGSLYEWPDLPRAGEIRGKSNFRHDRLTAALASRGPERDAVRLEALFAMDDDEFLGKRAGPAPGAREAQQSLHYAMAHEACRYLDATGQLWPLYREWRERWGDDPTGEASFAHVTGRPPRRVTPDWLAWVTDKKNDDRTPGRLP